MGFCQGGGFGHGRWRQHPGRSALPGSQFQGRLLPALPVRPARQRLGRLRSRLLRGRSQLPAEAAPAGRHPSAGSGRLGDGPLCRGPSGRAAPPWARGGMSPTPACRRHSVPWHGAVGLGWMGLTRLSIAWHGLAMASATCGWPAWLGLARHSSGSTKSHNPEVVPTCASPRLRLLDSHPTVTQQCQCHPAAWQAPELPLPPAPCPQVVRVMGSPSPPVLAPQEHVGPWCFTMGTTVGA